MACAQAARKTLIIATNRRNWGYRIHHVSAFERQGLSGGERNVAMQNKVSRKSAHRLAALGYYRWHLLQNGKIEEG